MISRGLSHNRGSTGWKACTTGRGGFTLLEVLVVLGILVVLFALLFVPMTTSVNIATSGRRQAEMQQDLRMAMEQAARDLTEATYVYPPELIRIATASSVYTGEHEYMVNYSAMSFVLPKKDAGQPLQPLQPVFQSPYSGAQELPVVTRYAVHTADTVLRVWPPGSPPGSSLNPSTKDKVFMVSAGPGPESTFQLYRQQGYCIYDADLGTYTFGSYADVDVDGNGTITNDENDVFVIDRPNAENALTPRMGADVICTQTVCRDNGQSVAGYVPATVNATGDLDPSPGAGWTTQLVYLFDGIQFRPERIADDPLRISADGSTYRSSRGAWLGLLNDGTRSIYDLVWGLGGIAINSSELRPRIVVRRWAAGAYSTTVMDTDQLGPLPQVAPDAATNNLLNLRWNSRAGQVTVADTVPVPAQVDSAPGVVFAQQVDPGPGFWTIGPTRADVLPEWPTAPTSRNDARAPVGYVLDPWRAEGVVETWNPWSIQPQAADRDIKIIPESLRVWVVFRRKTTDEVQRREMARVNTQDQDQIGLLQYTATPFDEGKQVELRFNPSVPPGPDLVARLIDPSLAGVLEFSCEIQIYYQARRNFDPVSGRDDQIVVSYSTGSAYNLKLALTEYSPYEAPTSGAASQVPFKPGAQSLMSARLPVQNVSR